MKLLLDTHALLWWLADDQRLNAGARRAIADATNDILVSVVSFWEITVKVRVGKLEADIKEVMDAAQRQQFGWLDITAAHLLTLSNLPTHHRDPFDHLLIAQAMTEAATFISADRNVRRYRVRLLACSDVP